MSTELFAPNYIRISLHLFGIVILILDFWGLSHLESPSFGGHSQYLSNVGLFFSLISYGLALYRDVFPLHFKSIHEFFIVVATPLEALITLLYWTLHFYNDELVNHEPISLDLSIGLHVIPTLLLWVDFLGYNKEFIRSWNHILYIFIFTFAYTSWVSYCFTRNGFWAYPILGFLDSLSRLIFFGFCGVLITVIYEIGSFVHQKLHRTIQEATDAIKKGL